MSCAAALRKPRPSDWDAPMPELTYEQIADLADIIVAHEAEDLAPFELARAILQAGYGRVHPDA